MKINSVVDRKRRKHFKMFVESHHSYYTEWQWLFANLINCGNVYVHKQEECQRTKRECECNDSLNAAEKEKKNMKMWFRK